MRAVEMRRRLMLEQRNTSCTIYMSNKWTLSF
jgi:hypothetical protein